MGSFWGHQQVGDLLAYLRALANPLDEVALYSILASPLVGLSSDTLVHISLAARAAQSSVWETLRSAPAELERRLTPPQWQRLTAFTELFAAERAQATRHPLAELLRRALALTGYEQHVLGLPHGPRRLANVHKLLRLARRFEAAEGRELRGFLKHIDHQLEMLESAEPEAPVADGQDAVRLMTIHAAKGLEFPLVALADLGRRPGANRSNLLVEGPRMGLRLAQLDGSPGVPTLDYEELLAERREAEALEEQRILYVALTRARGRLLLSGGIDFGNWPADVPGAAPLAWLAPALAGEIPALARELPVLAAEAPALAAEIPAPGRERQEPVRELDVDGAPGVRVRCFFNTPATLGAVLREESLRPLPLPLSRSS